MMKLTVACLGLIAVFALFESGQCTVFGNGISALTNGITTYQGVNAIGGNPLIDGIRKRCPLCDSSVYPYCSDKLFHDSCCCNNNNPYEQLPYECTYADCSFLHANSCYEHKLITSCCCSNYLYRK